MISSQTRQVAGKFRLSLDTVDTMVRTGVRDTWSCWGSNLDACRMVDNNDSYSDSFHKNEFSSGKFSECFECAFFWGRGRSRLGGGRGDGIGAELRLLGEQLQVYQISKCVRLSVLYHLFHEKNLAQVKSFNKNWNYHSLCTFNHLKFGLVFWDVLPSVLLSYRNCPVQSFVHSAETRVKLTRWHGAFRTHRL